MAPDPEKVQRVTCFDKIQFFARRWSFLLSYECAGPNHARCFKVLSRSLLHSRSVSVRWVGSVQVPDSWQWDNVSFGRTPTPTRSTLAG